MKLAALALLGALVLPPALASSPTPSPDSTQLIEQGSYINADGTSVHRPAHTRSGRAPAGASARCRDGSYSFSKHRSGTCSRHGGVALWLDSARRPAPQQ
ncbi:DUF3761 domain-containing protein [Paludibacterium yongneupense]|uniref:DUF3761 domain-containing protein n=1 Tax=Paludibacterium yongneupense TaxID=400061 RepID=UPI00040BD017|nr:DUF3761 domain-containing protein [Paludibacterium yongneupense]